MGGVLGWPPAQEGGLQSPLWISEGRKFFELTATDGAVLYQGSQS